MSARPFLKWAGGKTQLLPELRARLTFGFGCYFEPFAGAAAHLFSLKENWPFMNAVLGDTNSALIETYAELRDNAAGVIYELQALAKRYNKLPESTYYAQRTCFNAPGGSNARQAARFILLNKTCFNGLYRVNRKGLFNVPWGKKLSFEPDSTGLAAASSALKKVTLTTDDFEKCVAGAKKGDFVYFDPPYVPASASSNFTAYQKEPFGPAEQERLRNVALHLKQRGVHVLLSNSDTPLVRKLYAKGFKIEEVSARRNINSKGAKRGVVGEVLIT